MSNFNFINLNNDFNEIEIDNNINTMKKNDKPIMKNNRKIKNKRFPLNVKNIIELLQTNTWDILNDILVLPYFIKTQNGFVTGWAKEIFKPKNFNTIFDFKSEKPKISSQINKFKMPVFVPWIEKKDNSLINHSNGVGMYRTYTNKYFDLMSSELLLKYLDRSWNIDLWLSILSNIPLQNIYTINQINILSSLYIELIRSYSTSLHKNEREIYDNIKKYINDIYEYLTQNNLIEMNYNNYSSWPNNIKIAMDALTEGEIKFYFGSEKFYKINIHNDLIEIDTQESRIMNVINTILHAKEHYINNNKNQIFELENSNIINQKIIKMIYNILEMPKEVDLNLETHKKFMGEDFIKHYNKISILNDVIKYIIGFNRKFEDDISKIDKLCLIWNIINKMKEKDSQICKQYNKDISDIDNEINKDEMIFRIMETSQTNLKSLIQILAYELLTILKNNINVSLNESQINTLEDIINSDLKVNNIELYKLMNHNIWFKYKLENSNEIPTKYNYTPIKLYYNKKLSINDLPKILKLNAGYSVIEKYLK